jgi:hypothetical protein
MGLQGAALVGELTSVSSGIVDFFVCCLHLVLSSTTIRERRMIFNVF